MNTHGEVAGNQIQSVVQTSQNLEGKDKEETRWNAGMANTGWHREMKE